MGDLVSVEKRKPRLLGEALRADDGAALAECGGEGGDEVVVEVENRGGGRGAAGDAADLLDDVAFERDWCGEGEGVEGWEVHALAGDLGHGDEDEAGCGGESVWGMDSYMQMLPTCQSMFGVFKPLCRGTRRWAFSSQRARFAKHSARRRRCAGGRG